MWADFHWHARDGNQSHKDTLKRDLELAYAAGGLAIGAMPNTNPPLTNLRLCRDYLELAKDAGIQGVQFYVHIGLTSDLKQVKRAVEAYRKEPGICGMKIYLGRSTGDLSVIDEDDQMRVIYTLVKEGYDGILVAHCEKESFINDKAYNPKKPKTWNTKCRPEIAEYESFRDITGIARGFGFQGTIHVAHVSTLKVVDYVYDYRNNGRLKLSCGLTPHHAFMSDKYLEGKYGARNKCNPPLRSRKTQEGLQDRLLEGRIPIIESDHAPHTREDKKYKKAKKKGGGAKLPAPGISSGIIWPYMKRILLSKGMSEEKVKAATFDNSVRLYGLEDKIEPVEREIDWDVLERIAADYPHNPFDKIFEERIFR